MANIRQFTVFALIFLAILGMACAAPDAPTPANAPGAAEGGDASSGGASGGSAEAPAAAADGSASPSEGPAASDASIFKVTVAGALVKVATATLFFF